MYLRMTELTCPNGCCALRVHAAAPAPYHRKPRPKAGVVVHDPASDSLLLVQSRGNLWGVPKGGCEPGESYQQSAARELMEETGLTFDIDNVHKTTSIQNTGVYFLMTTVRREVVVQTTTHDNDANGIGWVKIKCLESWPEIHLNYPTRISLRRFFGIDLRR